MDEKTITLTEEERNYLQDVVFDHMKNIGPGGIYYGDDEDNEYMKNLYKNILEKLSK